jgi:hypothetical protein
LDDDAVLITLLKNFLILIGKDSDFKNQLTSQIISDIQKDVSDHEQRIRNIEVSSTQFKFLVSLAAGGGLLSIISLLREFLK